MERHRADVEVLRLKEIRIKAVADEKLARLDRQILRLKTERQRSPRKPTPSPAPLQAADPIVAQVKAPLVNGLPVRPARHRPAKPPQPKARKTVKKGMKT